MTHRSLTTILLASILGIAATAAGSAQTTHEVTANPDNTFSPQNLTIQAGDSIRWSNQGGDHNVNAPGLFRCANGCDDTGGNGSPSASAWSFTRTFNDPGQISYRCDRHFAVGMVGTITVQPGVSTNPGILRMAQTNVPVGEGAGTATLRVQRINGDDGPASVQYSTANGSAVAPADYTAVAGSLTWADNDDATRTFTVPIVDDGNVENQERFTVILSNASGAALGSPTQSTVTINDNDSAPPPGEPGQVELAQDVFEVNEVDGSAMVTLQRVGGATGTASVDLTASGGTATPGQDYQETTETVTWSAGDAAPKQVVVPLIDDAEDEGVETIQLGLGRASGASLGATTTGKVAIFDDDGGAGCTENTETLCLNEGDRFKVQMSFRTQQGDHPRGKSIFLNRDSGLFYFANPDNAEVLVKVLNSCIPILGNRFWVFFAATTNQEFTLTVTDTRQGAMRYYNNDFSPVEPAKTVLDVRAFATCP